jgi:hypothetical protein
MPAGEVAVERGVDGRRARVQVEGGVGEERDLLVLRGALVTLVGAGLVGRAKAEQLVLVERGEVLAGARAEVAAGALDPEDLGRLAREGSFSTTLEEVLPPPVLVMRWSAPSRLER